MRPVKNKGTSHPSYTRPSTLSFSAKAAAVIAKVMNKPSPSLLEYLDVWLEFAKAENLKKQKKPTPPNYDDLRDARALIQKAIEPYYKTAAVPLMDLFGEYCSYCETQIPCLLEVEHVVPKSQYPYFVTEWKNFLLSCGPCNKAKSDRPTRIDLKNLIGADPTSETACYDEIRTNYYAWPDLEPKSYRLFPARMVHDPGDQGVWQLVHIMDAIELDNAIDSVDVASQTVRADIPSLGSAGTGVKVRVEIEAPGPSALPDRVVKLCKLNDLGASNTTYDRRVFNRTRAWFEILEAVKHILKIKNPAAFDAAWTVLCMNAKNRGFFSLWVRILENGLHTDPNGQSLMHRLIDSLCRDPSRSPQYFPGTDTTAIP